MKILTCNIRKSDADDGPDNWDLRRDICGRILAAQEPDIVCFQEMRHTQLLDMLAALPGFSWFGITKTATCLHPINAIFYRLDQFLPVAAGGYWLSETPHLPGSSSWESASIRLANWIRLRDYDSGVAFRVVNTHLDHGSEMARCEQARMVKDDADCYPPAYPQLLTGDINAVAGSPALHILQEGGWQSVSQLPAGADNTFHGFRGAGWEGPPRQLDWIFAKGNIRFSGCRLVDNHENGKYPSDHYFVASDVEVMADDCGA